MCSTEIYFARLGDNLKKINSKMIKLAISQVPVFDGDTCIRMITDNVITQLLATNLDEIKINKKMLEPSPPKVDVNAVARPLSTILNFFDCILVEKNGKTHGIIVRHDLNKLFTGNKIDFNKKRTKRH